MLDVNKQKKSPIFDREKQFLPSYRNSLPFPTYFYNLLRYTRMDRRLVSNQLRNSENWRRIERLSSLLQNATIVHSPRIKRCYVSYNVQITWIIPVSVRINWKWPTKRFVIRPTRRRFSDCSWWPNRTTIINEWLFEFDNNQTTSDTHKLWRNFSQITSFVLVDCDPIATRT